MSLINTDWLLENSNNVKIIDSSWHLPNQNRNAEKEYSNEHIINSIFFDIDKNSDQETDLPHMLPSVKKWEGIVSNLGISTTCQLPSPLRNFVLSAVPLPSLAVGPDPDVKLLAF